MSASENTIPSLAESQRRSGILELVGQNPNPANRYFDSSFRSITDLSLFKTPFEANKHRDFKELSLHAV
ncbi:hypothetical protein, partial [Vibrio echinoideorum]|uniref:hypothetical protein n=1 Tax=Vibrio echinoideorum TaxID=2100116 RepID=UPI00354D86EE